MDEVDETIIVDVSSVTGGSESGTQQVTATITDDDGPTVTLSLVGSPMGEAAETTIVTALLSAVSPQDVTVALGFTGTATYSSDYTRTGTTITIPAGSISRSITLTAVQDTLREPDETVIVDITGVTNGSESARSR